MGAGHVLDDLPALMDVIAQEAPDGVEDNALFPDAGGGRLGGTSMAERLDAAWMAEAGHRGQQCAAGMVPDFVPPLGRSPQSQPWRFPASREDCTITALWRRVCSGRWPEAVSHGRAAALGAPAARTVVMVQKVWQHSHPAAKGPRMLYSAYEWQRRLTAPARTTSELLSRTLEGLPAPVAGLPGTRRLKAACTIVASAHPTHVRPDWGIDHVAMEDGVTEVDVRSVVSTPFATLLHFAKPAVTDQPRMLLVGPISGHFATLLRPTVRTLLADHDVYVLDWHNARDVPAVEGRFGLDEYIDHVMEALRRLGPDSHVLAVCQPAPLVLAAVAVLAAAGDAAQPRTLTLMAGPIDTRVNPNRINKLADRSPLSFYERFLVTRVPNRYPGRGRRVYPGVAQLTAFMSMNARRHADSYRHLFRALVTDDEVTATRIRDFYDEYGAVMDVPAEFYLETLQHVFMEHDLPRGAFTWRGQRVQPQAIRETALLTIEGAQDDLCSPGQTHAAHRLCTGIPEDSKRHHLQEGVGHYGVFAGSRWEREIYPVLRAFVGEHRAVRAATG